MRIFYVTIDFNLENAPQWLDDFRQKYDDEYEPQCHLTLKQATFFEEHNKESLENVLREAIRPFSPIRVEFEQITYGSTENGNVIMLMAKLNDDLKRLQSAIVNGLEQFGHVIKPYYHGYELDFQPHITIARHLSDQQVEFAKEELGNIVVSAEVETVTLHISKIEFKEDEYPEYETVRYAL